MSKADPASDTYVHQRDWSESNRSALQDRVMQKRVDGDLHPRVAEHFEPCLASSLSPVRICDVAIGIGVIALDIAEQYQSVSASLMVIALDISAAQFPAPATVPWNVHFAVYNMFELPLSKHVAALDVLHIRFVVDAFITGGQGDVLQNLRAMLKPDGWLQWTEIESPFWAPVDLHTMEFTGEITP